MKSYELEFIYILLRTRFQETASIEISEEKWVPKRKGRSSVYMLFW